VTAQSGTNKMKTLVGRVSESVNQELMFQGISSLAHPTTELMTSRSYKN
jgi:hypothetical protein